MNRRIAKRNAQVYMSMLRTDKKRAAVWIRTHLKPMKVEEIREVKACIEPLT